MQRAYLQGNELENYQRPPPRTSSVGSLQDRANQYCQHDTHFNYGSRPLPFRTPQNAQECEVDARHTSRRRIAVACSRCRRRKIRCTGDPGDGSGCSACKSSGADPKQCTFNRVGSTTMAISPNDTLGSSLNGFDLNYQFCHPSRRQLDHRASMPMLQSRSQLNKDMPGFYETCDIYTPSLPSTYRHDSAWNLYGPQSGYTYGSTLPISLPIRHDSLPATMIEQDQSAAYQYSSQAFAHTSTENLVAMNLTALGTSLPVQSSSERRLPVPHTPNADLHSVYYAAPGVRSVHSSIGFRPLQFNDRMVPAWIHDREASQFVSQRSSSLVPTSHAHADQASSIIEPVLGYQFSNGTTYSPRTSSTTMGEVTELSSSTSSTSSTTRSEGQSACQQRQDMNPATSASSRSMLRSNGQANNSLYSLDGDPGVRSSLVGETFTYEVNREQYSALRHHQQVQRCDDTQQALDYSQPQHATYRGRTSLSSPIGKL